MADFTKANGLFGGAAKILLAVSGGADSTALLYVMCALKAEGVLTADLICAHINHQLRGAEAELDEDFVVAQACSLNLLIITRRLDVAGFACSNKLSTETAARKLRIEGLIDIAGAENCRFIATAHQKCDNAETVLQRLCRGTGLRGLGGIWPVRSFADEFKFVRPLLCVTRREVVEYLRQRDLKWREDKTNEDCRYRRNYIRHRLIPALQQQCSGSVVEQLSVLSQSARRFYSLVCSRAEEVWPELADCNSDRVVLDLKRFQPEAPAVKTELVRRSLACIGSGERDLRYSHYEEILRLAEQNVSGKKIELPNGFLVWREYGKLVFGRLKENEQPEDKTEVSKKIEIPGRTRFGNYLIEATVFEAKAEKKLTLESTRKLKTQNSKLKTVEWFDLDKVSLPLEVRFRRTGDRFWPLGLASEKRVGKFLTAAKVPQQLRQKALIVADSEKIIWLWPIRMSEQAKITSMTRKILELQIEEAK